MRKFYIADDEASIRQGLKLLVDWQALGYTLCGEAGNGTDALAGITREQPDLVLIDIRMPGLTGLELIGRLTSLGFAGHFIILSGYSDFEYAKTAMHYNVRHYLTKPIDEDELIEAVNDISALIDAAETAQSHEAYLRTKSRREIIQDILAQSVDFSRFDPAEFDLGADSYQIVAYESFDINNNLLYRLSELFGAASRPGQPPVFEAFEYRHHSLLLLLGHTGIDRFKRFLAHYETGPETGSPLDSLFIAYGCPVTSLVDLHISHAQVEELLLRRFFCISGQHVLGYELLPSVQHNLVDLQNDEIGRYSALITDYLQTFNRRKVAETLYGLEEYLYHVRADIQAVKLFLTDLYLRVKETMTHRYNDEGLPFDTNANIIAFVHGCNYLYEIITRFSKQFEDVMNSIGNSSRDSVMDDILYYINHNYHTNLKLETIAALFGYNSSYLGKIFSKTVGESFNIYVDRIRIDHAIELLRDGQLKVYEIADRIGYKNVDYFHKKFKKYVGESPAEYRKKLGLDDSE